MREHVEDRRKLPILIFPEGTCINNTSVMMFKKGSFEVSDRIFPVAIKYDALFGDAFWNSSKQSWLEYLVMMMTSWAIVCDVWYLPPMDRVVSTSSACCARPLLSARNTETFQKGEAAISFASRVKKEIAEAGGFLDLDWDGQLKRQPLPKKLKDQFLGRYSRRLT